MRPNCVIVYRVLQDAVEVLRVLHAAAVASCEAPRCRILKIQHRLRRRLNKASRRKTWTLGIFSNEIRDLELPLVQTKHRLPRWRSVQVLRINHSMPRSPSPPCNKQPPGLEAEFGQRARAHDVAAVHAHGHRRGLRLAGPPDIGMLGCAQRPDPGSVKSSTWAAGSYR
jgi:hypothetical protein